MQMWCACKMYISTVSTRRNRRKRITISTHTLRTISHAGWRCLWVHQFKSIATIAPLLLASLALCTAPLILPFFHRCKNRAIRWMLSILFSLLFSFAFRLFSNICVSVYLLWVHLHNHRATTRPNLFASIFISIGFFFCARKAKKKFSQRKSFWLDLNDLFNFKPCTRNVAEKKINKKLNDIVAVKWGGYVCVCVWILVLKIGAGMCWLDAQFFLSVATSSGFY